jgi:hypothetical protein
MVLHVYFSSMSRRPAMPPMFRRTRPAAFVFALLLALILPLRAHAQGIEGEVVDAEGRRLLNALVTVQPGDAAIRTDGTGRFALPTLRPGSYRVRVRRIGFREHVEQIVVAPGQRARLYVTLQPAAPMLDTVRVRVDPNTCDNASLAGFECRKQSGVGFLRDADELAARRPEQLFDLIGDLPGIRPVSSRGPNGIVEMAPSVRPSRCLKMLVNGRPEIAARWWTARDVVAVEYYNEWRHVPLAYRQIVDNVSCDLIVYWLTTAP